MKLQISLKGDMKAFGAFTYDSMGKKLRFRSNESYPTNSSLGLDLLMLFDEVGDFFIKKTKHRSLNAVFLRLDIWIRLYILQGVFYEIDSKNQSCEKKTLHCTQHPLDIPDDATFMRTVNTGSPSIEGEGLKVSVWKGAMADMKGERNMTK